MTRAWGHAVLDTAGSGWSHSGPVEAGAEPGGKAGGSSVQSPPKMRKLLHQRCVRNSPVTARVEEEEKEKEGEGEEEEEGEQLQQTQGEQNWKRRREAEPGK